MVRTSLISCVLLLALLPMGEKVTSASTVHRLDDPGPADSITKLVPPYPNDARIPLILIHGIHGTEDSNKNGILDKWEAVEQSSDWDEFLAFYRDNPALMGKYKIYRFHYLSDIERVWEIARSLRNHLDSAIDNGVIDDTEFVIVAHSTGGLVARSYMEEHSHNTGRYVGKRGGERIVELITLATPHHGSPIANNEPRVDGLRFPDWDIVTKEIDVVYWGMVHGCYSCGVLVNRPNRADVRWDNFDGLWDDIPNEYLHDDRERNDWLRNIPHNYDEKITAYYGYIGDRNGSIARLGDEGPYQLQATLIARALGDKHDALNTLGVFVERVSSRNFRTSITSLTNDGIVPVQSGAFIGHLVASRVGCPGYDHLHMLEAADTPCTNGLPLFQSLARDLDEAVTPEGPTLRINGGESSTRRQLEHFIFTGSNYMPNRPVSRFLRQEPDGSWVEMHSELPFMANDQGEIYWEFTPPCDYEPGTYTLKAVDGETVRESNPVTEIVEPNPTCEGNDCFLPGLTEIEPNDNISQANPISPDIIETGSLCPGGDVDYYWFDASAGQIITIDIDAEDLNPLSDADTVLTLFDGDENVLAENNNDFRFDTRDSYLQLFVPRSGRYYFRVRDISNRGGESFTYQALLTLL